ncbi:UPF0146 family protein [Methanobrevibacter curvatus]|uniref:UPF0146 protein MBCUR_05560 n=1 Tax=Methanobrevibacter curvatus TaxID=49547 RepID=A0A166CBE3_9EURY|nr:UPF0146 family protein [Methanobrevibacter curvatus]KZX14332.1 hypothetical protein MBCUR_05560 [Methanobrevibacter curvatus]
MWKSLGEYIEKKAIEKSKLKDNNKKVKVIEIAVGKFFDVSNYLKKSNCNEIDLILTDINPDNSKIIKDDIFNPNFEIYNNADIIYSIRPPYELQENIIKLANKENAILIIKPLYNDDIYKKEKMKLKSYKKTNFYQLKK